MNLNHNNTTFHRMFYCRLITYFIFILFFIPFASWAENIYIEPLSGSGIDESQLNTVTELVKSAVNDLEVYSIVNSSSESHLLISGKILKLGNSYIMILSKIIDGKKIATHRLKSMNMEEIDSVCVRLVNALLTETSVQKENPSKENQAINNKTTENKSVSVEKNNSTEETQTNDKKDFIRQWEIGLGPSNPSHLNNKGLGTNWLFGFLWGFENRYELHLTWEFLAVKAQSDVNFTDVHMGLNYFFNDDNTSLYTTGDIGYGAATAHSDTEFNLDGKDDSASGFSVGIGGGIKFFRSSNVNLGLQLRYCQILASTAKTNNQPNVTNINLSIYF